MQTLELRTTTSKGFTFHDIQPFVRPPEGPGGTCRLSRAFWLRIGWVAALLSPRIHTILISL